MVHVFLVASLDCYNFYLKANYGNMRYMQPPMMQPPMMQPPMMQPPMMQPPMMQPPMMQPPVMQPPVMQPPIMQPPVSSSGCGGNIDTGCSSKVNNYCVLYGFLSY